jgi:hypothetical protein
MNTRKDSIGSKRGGLIQPDKATQPPSTVTVERRSSERRGKRGVIRGNTEDIRQEIIKALSDTRYKGRTISGVAQEIHRSPELVVKTIKSDATLRGIIKIYPRRNADGQVLITTKERFSQYAGLKDKFIDFYTTNKITLDDAA